MLVLEICYCWDQIEDEQDVISVLILEISYVGEQIEDEQDVV